MYKKKQPRHWGRQGFFPFRLEVLTPVFIGSGDTLSPLEYVIRKEKEGYTLHRIDLQSWLIENASEPSVQKIIASGDIARIRPMLDEKVDTAEFSIISTPIVDSTLAVRLKSAYDGVQGDQARQKNKTGEVSAALRNPAEGYLYIPGSSLKGAISTPLIDWLDKQLDKSSSLRAAMNHDPKNGATNWMKNMFGSITEHAMQALKISDVPASLSAGIIIRALERSRNPAKKGTPKPPCEVIPPGEDALWGRLLMDCPTNEGAISLPNGKLVSFPELVQICNKFYTERFHREMDKFYALPHLKNVRDALMDAENRVKALNDTRMLLRIGHYSHIESVTIENNQPFTRKGKNGAPMPFGTTRTLADGKLPFGWVLLHFCTLDEYEEGMRKSENTRNTALAAQRQAITERRRKAERCAAETIQLRNKQEERRLADEQKR